ncbi:MAG TPA: methyltransferase domain-containing protein, partial [Baekduia sp.]|nr:methyltransferase domain-containing protein [Baekduia sp.]
MTTDPQVISKMAAHFSPPNMRELVAETLRESGVEMGSASIEEVAMFDQLHVGGLDANRRLAALAQIGADDLVLDAGCGAGGAARFLATTFGCEVRGIDMTPALLETGELLNEATGLGDKVSLQLGDVTAVPFEDETFDVAWLQHVTQSVPDTADMYAEMRRVLKPGGRLVVHDFFRGP